MGVYGGIAFRGQGNEKQFILMKEKYHVLPLVFLYLI
jgi:hypothetical protein